MGQPVAVVHQPTSIPGIIRFEANRSLTGMGHERYRSADDALGDRPPDVLARRLFEHSGVRSVYIYGNVVQVEVASGTKPDEIEAVVRELYLHYQPGVTPSVTA